MTYQEVLWAGKIVWVVSLLSKSGKIHRYLRKYVGKHGIVRGEAKNGTLLIEFSDRRTRAVPAGCVADFETPTVAG